MAKDDLFRRTIDAGTAFVDMSRERAEAVVKEWVDAGDLGRGMAKKAVDDLLERSHRITDEVGGMIRREISSQLAALGVATREDVARVEAKVDAAADAGRKRPATTTPRRVAKKAAPITKSAARGAAAKSTARSATKAPAKKAPAKKAAGGTRKAPGTTRARKTAGPGTGPGT